MTNKKKKVFIKHSDYVKKFHLSMFGETKESFQDNPVHVALINEYKYGDKNDFYHMYRQFIKSSDIIKDDKKDDLIKLLNNGNLKKLLSNNDIISLEIKDQILQILSGHTSEQKVEEENQTIVEETTFINKWYKKYFKNAHNNSLKVITSNKLLSIEVIKMRLLCR